MRFGPTRAHDRSGEIESPAADASARYAAVRVSVHQIGRDRALVHVTESGEVADLPLGATQMLARCHGSRTIEAHADALQGAGVTADRAAVVSVLRALAEVGLLREQADWLRPASRSSHTEPASISTVGIVTADRPAALRRCLDSVVAHAQPFGRRPRLLVVDGSSDRASAAANRALLDGLAAAGHDAGYVGHPEARRLRAGLDRAGVDPALVAFGLTPGAVGSNRNLLRLLTAGEDVLMLDDDVRCEPWAAPDAGCAAIAPTMVRFRGHGEARRVAFFATREEAFAAAAPAQVDLLAAHEALLGRSLGNLVNDAGTEVDLSDACGHVLDGLVRRGGDPVVAITMAGLAGDAAIHSPYSLLFSSGTMRSHLTVTPGALAMALGSREVHRIAPYPIVTHDHACMAYCTAISRYAAPLPFLPIGRNEDGVFGAMLAFSEPRALFGHVPVGVLHDSDRPSSYDDAVAMASQVRLSEIVLALLSRAGLVRGTDWSAKSARIAALFTEAGECDSTDLRMLLVDAILDRRCRDLTHLEGMLPPPGAVAGPEWHRAFARFRETLAAQAVEPDFVVPAELNGISADGHAMRRLQSFLRSFGALLQVWPEVIACQRVWPC